MSELPADIAEAIEVFRQASQAFARQVEAANGIHVMRTERTRDEARAALGAVILKHISKLGEYRETIQDYRNAAITHVYMEGIQYRGCSNSAFRHAWEADREQNGSALSSTNLGRSALSETRGEGKP